jgi:hypothetical protein
MTDIKPSVRYLQGKGSGMPRQEQEQAVYEQH